MRKRHSPKLLICSRVIPHAVSGVQGIILHYYIEQFRQTGYRILHVLGMEDHPDTRDAYTA